MEYHLAQYNIARLIAPLDDPRLEPFMEALDPLNRLADESPGFVWRHQTEEGNSTSIRVRGDPAIIINFSVWESADSLFDYAYKSDHAEIYRRRREFFELHERPYLVCWWIPAGHEPTVEEAEERLRHLEEHGPTPHAFTLKKRFPAPDRAPAIESPS
ncbi:MAG TPA: DUF3291 domain-containing protein [Dehalococcoidia bacterium]